MSSSATGIALLIFDLDGTLIDSQVDIILSVNHMLRQLSLPELSHERVVSFIGYGVKELIKRSLGSDNGGLFDKALTIFNEYYPKHAAVHTRLYPEVKETLESLQAIPKLIITNKQKKLAEGSLNSLGIAGFFLEVIGGDDESCRKPSACPIEDVLKKYRIGAEKAMIVGDMAVDIQAGKNAGIRTCAVTYGIGRREDIENASPDYIIEDFSSLRQIVVSMAA